MRLLPVIFLLLGSCFAAPSDPKPIEEDRFVFSDSFLKDDYVLYTAKHDIVRIFAPYSQFNFKFDFWSDWMSHGADASSSSEENATPKSARIVFFVEADVNNGKKTEQGLYVYKSGSVTKLLDNGRDAIANNENVIYFGASDGIYKYNEAANTAEKYGNVKDDIIQLAFFNATNTIYYVTANHEVFKLNADASTSVKVPEISDVQKLVFSYDSKMYYTDSEKNVYVFDEVNNKPPVKIEGVPATAENIVLVDPIKGMRKGVMLLVDKVLYKADVDGASMSRTSLESAPTAYDPKPTIIHFYAKDKKLYELDIIAILKSNKESLQGEFKKLVDMLPSKY